MELGYYPGCSLESSAVEYDQSINDICKVLDIKLRELEDWNCCGATSAHSINEEISFRLASRNLEIAEKTGLDLVIPCSGCFNRLKTAEKNALNNTRYKGKSSFEGNIKVMDMLSVFSEETILTNIKEQIVKPLEGLKVAAYYGCLSLRPPRVLDVENYENPQKIENIMRALGAEAVEWPLKTVCCGGSLALTRLDIVKKLVNRILNMAQEVEADCIVTSCPLCQANLDTREKDISKEFSRDYNFPIFYFTELIGLAMGRKKIRKWLGKHLVDPKKVLRARGLI